MRLVSVIVLTFNARDCIESCLDAVFFQDYPNFEVIVVDNASSDGTASFVRTRFPEAKVIESATNAGYGAGNNLGASKARGDIFAFLNPDAVPKPDWLSSLVGGMLRYSRQFATSKIILKSDAARLNSGGNVIHYLGPSFCRGLNMPSSTFDVPEDVTSASGAACAISRPLFIRIGGFDESFFMYYDDADISLRALLAGEPCLYVPDAVVAHDYVTSVPAKKWGWVEAHRYAVLLKVFSLRTVVILLPALLIIDLLTFAYLAWRGPIFIGAKLRSYGWLARHAGSIRTSRRRAQAFRELTDRQVLSVLADEIPYEQLASPPVAALAHRLIDPWFRSYRRLALSFLH